MSDSQFSEALSRSIAAKCGAIVSQRILWERAARKLLDSELDDQDANQLLLAFRSPRNLEGLLKGLAADGVQSTRFLAELKSAVDGSDYSFQEWISSFEAAQVRLANESRVASPSSLLGYIQCSAEFASGSREREELAALVLAMLDQYGFEGREGCGVKNSNA